MKFINRTEEIAELRGLASLSKKKLFVIAIYGLRRVGKTRLLLEFMGKDGAYFFVNKNKTSKDLLAEFQELLKAKKVLGELEALDSWDTFFRLIITRGISPVVFDEFQNFAFVEPSVFGILQKNIDLNEEKHGLIILSGSLIGLVKKLFEGSKEPLYGRIKSSKKLEPLSLSSCFKIGKELELKKEELLKVYFLFGGYPKYYVTIEDFNLKGKTAEEIVGLLFLSKNAPLEDEVSSILSQEFGGRSGIYYSILEAIATGNNRLSAIAGYLNVQPTSITRQINELVNIFELIKLEMPYEGKRGIYKIEHPLLNFWFSQIYKNFSDYAARDPEFVKSVGKGLNSFYGKGFERAAAEFLSSKLGLVGRRQWGKIPMVREGESTYEIDFIGKREGLTYVFEFKWQELSYKEAAGILEAVEIKAKHVTRLGPRIRFGIIAKKIADKQKLNDAGHIAYDLDDF